MEVSAILLPSSSMGTTDSHIALASGFLSAAFSSSSPLLPACITSSKQSKRSTARGVLALKMHSCAAWCSVYEQCQYVKMVVVKDSVNG